MSSTLSNLRSARAPISDWTKSHSTVIGRDIDKLTGHWDAESVPRAVLIMTSENGADFVHNVTPASHYGQSRDKDE
jgi:hypothetical protein